MMSQLQPLERLTNLRQAISSTRQQGDGGLGSTHALGATSPIWDSRAFSEGRAYSSGNRDTW